MSSETLDQQSGLLDDYTLPVSEAWFGLDDESERESDQIYLFIRGDASVDGKVVEEQYRERYSIGSGWEVADEGRTIEHGSGKHKPKRNSSHGRLVGAIVHLFDENDDMATLETLADESGTNTAEFWESLTFAMERKAMKPFMNDDGEMQEWELPLPIKVVLTKPKKKGGGKKSGSSKAKGGSKAKDKATIDPEVKLRKRLVKLAATFDEDDHDEFATAAIEKYGDKLEAFDELHADVLDDDGDVWEEAH